MNKWCGGDQHESGNISRNGKRDSKTTVAAGVEEEIDQGGEGDEDYDHG